MMGLLILLHRYIPPGWIIELAYVCVYVYVAGGLFVSKQTTTTTTTSAKNTFFVHLRKVVIGRRIVSNISRFGFPVLL